MSKKNCFNIQIAGFCFSVCCNNKRYYTALKKAYLNSTTRLRPNFFILLKMKTTNSFFIERINNKKGVIFFPDNGIKIKGLNFILLVLIEFFLLKKNILMLHASSIVKNGKAYVFCGKSGAGKSTIAAKNPTSEILSDETALIQKEKGKYYALSSFLDKNKYPEMKYKKAIVEGIFFINQSSVDKFVKIKPVDSIKKIMESSFMYETFFGTGRYKDKSLNKNIRGKYKIIKKKDTTDFFIGLNTITFDMIKKVKCRKLFFNKNFFFLSKL